MKRLYRRKISLILISVFVSIIAYSQDKFPELVTDRPDQTESSVVVPYKSLQIESGFVVEKSETALTGQKSFSYNSTLLRYGLYNNLELRLGLEYLGEKVKIKNTDSTTSITGFSPVYTGFKVKIADEDGWKPELAFLGGLVLPFTANKEFKPKYSAADLRFAFSHTLSNRFSLGYNLGAEWDGETAVPEYFFSISLAVGINDNLGVFIESFGWLSEDGDSEQLLDAGFTYLILPYFQFDVSAGIGIHNSIDNFISVGLTYRIPD